MVEPKRYQKRKRIYTRWDKQTEEVRIVKSKDTIRPSRRFTDEIAGLTREEKDVISNYAQDLFIHFREGEFILDFLSSVGENKMKLVSRVLLSPLLAKKLVRILKERE